MQTLRPSQVPEYLRNSKFFLGLNAADDDEFSIPSNHMKPNMNVDTFADITELLNTIRFWGLDVFPEAMIDFVARPSYQRYEKVKSILEPFRADLPSICAACKIAGEISGGEERLDKAMDSGDKDIVKYFHNSGARFSEQAIALAAGKNALDCLQYGLSATTAGHYPHRYGNVVYSEAVRNGCMDGILFLQQSGFPLQHPHFSLKEPGEYMDLPNIAASSGQLDILKYLHSQGCSLRFADRAAADAGHWDCLEYAIVNESFLISFSIDSLAQQLARAGLYKLFPRALSLSKKIDVQTTLKLAESRKWDLFQLCIQYITRPTLDLVLQVTTQGFLASLQRLHEVCVSEMEASGNSFNWLTYAASNNSTTGNSSSSSSSNVNPSDLAPTAAKTEQWECLRFLIAHGCPMQKSLTTVLAKAEQQDLYRLAIAHGAEVSVQAACYFARDGNLDLLQHALEHGCERSEEILQTAARYGQLQCLMHAHAQGCPWSAQVTLAAARGGHRECLQYLYEHGCPSTEQVRSVLRKRSIVGETK